MNGTELTDQPKAPGAFGSREPVLGNGVVGQLVATEKIREGLQEMRANQE